MTIQTNANILVAAKRETVTGTANTTVTGATTVRLIGSSGLQLKRTPIPSNELRADGLKTLSRLGAKTVDGSFATEISVGGATDLFIEGLLRTTWATQTSTVFSAMTTVALGTNTVTAAAGDWIATQGIRVGDVFKLVGTTVTANNNTNLIVTAISTLVITTTTGALTTLAATATGTLWLMKKAKNGTTPVRLSHTIEQYDADTDLSELFLGCRVVGGKFSFKPNAMATAEFSFMGMDRTILTTGTSPWFTSPTATTGLGLISDDSTIRYNGATVTTFTGLDLDFKLSAKGEAVLGSFVSPDIFDNDLDISGTISGLRSDFAALTAFDAETEFEIQVLLQEPNAAPKNFLSFFLPRCKISGISAAVGGNDGAKIETRTLMIGPKTAATGYDGTAVTVSSSAA